MRVHMIMQGKGGVGKTLASTLLAQYFLAHEKKIACFDTDPVNTSFAGYRSLNVKVLELMQDDEIKPRNFDNLIEDIANSDADEIIVDNGASSFVPLSLYLIDNDIPSVLADMDVEICLHSIIAGSQALLDCINGFNALIKNFTKNGKPENLGFYVWLNTFQGAIQIENKNFFEMKCYKNNHESIKAVLELPELKKDTFGADFTEILKNKQTFSEGYSDMSKPIMVRQRLKNLEKKLFKVLEEGGL
ncbi:AAA family ATPase [Ruminobacter sp. RM87]|uniref:nucleotide-binding protein n=1 Tax=Ruminobacter sp. RM87 TaxID=1200567 RepID=UPI0004E281DE|nr:AAA family ATPase [Ruminobacter sp. RM87]